MVQTVNDSGRVSLIFSVISKIDSRSKVDVPYVSFKLPGHWQVKSPFSSIKLMRLIGEAPEVPSPLLFRHCWDNM